MAEKASRSSIVSQRVPNMIATSAEVGGTVDSQSQAHDRAEGDRRDRS